MIVSVFIGILIITLLIIVVILFNRLKTARQEKGLLEKKYLELEKENRRNDDLLKYKLNPHLFRNALNAIQSHAYQSYYALDKLSNVLDYILYESDVKYVALTDEVAFAQSLIEINRLKTSPLFNLHVKNKINKEKAIYEQQLIAPLITINPIENAFKHVDLQRESAFISIVFDVIDGWFQLSVANSVEENVTKANTKGGVGNLAFNKRLDTVYGKNYRYNESIGNGIYTIRLEIKLLEKYA